MEDKHTPEEVVKGYNSLSMIATKQWITKRVYNRLYVSIPIDNSTSHHAIAQIYDEEYAELIARAPELLQQVTALTKENEQYKDAIKSRNILQEEDQTKIRELTEQVEKLKEEKQLIKTYSDSMERDGQNLATELSRLREERKELVEALREAEGHLPDDSAGHHISNKIKSLLKEE